MNATRFEGWERLGEIDDEKLRPLELNDKTMRICREVLIFVSLHFRS